MGLAVRILSRETLGAGGTITALSDGLLRLLVCETFCATSGAGGITLVVKLFEARLVEFSCGDGGTTLMAGSVGRF
jgi:hypothetical protein